MNSIKLNFEQFKDKVYSCWIGKNIGGTMGTPYEGTRNFLDIKGFSTVAGAPLPNDDLDLQLIWLHAVESVGAKNVNAEVLGELWLNTIVGNWNEYGIAKSNIRRGLVPPMSGDYVNSWKNSNGAWIRTEIWACLAPGCPDIAAKYAIEDAKVDHGAGEGTVAAAFVAAMQSSAFVLNDIRKCIGVGLSVIPTESRMADSIRFVIDCYERGMSARDTRDAVQKRNSDIGDGWFEAPSNVAYAIIGLLWGEGDFKKSMITAINCGDDTDCTAATVGATLGILGGSHAIPEDWKEHIGDGIITVSLSLADYKSGGRAPRSCTELSNRVITQAPHVLFANNAAIIIVGSESCIPENIEEQFIKQCELFKEKEPIVPYSLTVSNQILSATAVLKKEPQITENCEISGYVRVQSTRYFGDETYNLNLRWWLPDGFTAEMPKSAVIYANNNHSKPVTYIQFSIRSGESISAGNRCVLEITASGRSTALYVPIVLIG